MNLRRSSGFAAALLAGSVAFTGVAAADSLYPPAPAAESRVVVPGITFGGSLAGAETVTVGAEVTSVESAVAPGAPVVFAVAGFAAGTPVDVTVNDASVGSMPADGSGAVDVGPFRFSEPGSYEIVMSGAEEGSVGASRGMSVNGDVRTVTASVTVEADGVAGEDEDEDELAHTGTTAGRLALTGGALVALGAGFVAMTVRRTRRFES